MGTEVIRTACSKDCRDTCTLLVEVAGGRVTGVSGDPDNEITRGFICPKARYELQRLYSPDRLLYPMVRRDGALQRASWDEALDIVAEKLCRYRDDVGSLSVLHYSDKGTMGWLNDLEDRFFNLFGGVTVPWGTLCATAGTTAQALDFGDVIAHDPLDIINSRTILVWGRNPAFTNIHLLPLLKEVRSRGACVVLIDPVPTVTRNFCDHHLAPHPGTDGALALGMARVILDEGLEDHSYIEANVLGFDEFSSMLKNYPVDRVAEITGIATEKIKWLAVLYATQKPGSIQLGFGMQRYSNSGSAVRAIDALAAIAGNIGIAGGGANYSCGYPGKMKADISARDKRTHHRSFPKAAIPRHILQADDPPVKALFITRANPATQLPDSSLTRKAFQSVEFRVVVDLELTETAEMADVVLPCTTFFEQENIYSSWGHNYIIYGRQAIPPLGEAKNDWDIFSGLARRLGFGEEYGSSEQWLDVLLKPFLSGGIGREALKGKSFRCPGAPVVPWSNGSFKTPSGRFEIFSHRAEKMGAPPLPVYSHPSESTPEKHDRCGEYPFSLLSPAHSDSIHSQFYSHVEPGDLPFVHLGAGKAKELGILDGSLVEVVSPRGKLAGRAQLHQDFRDDVVLIYCGGSPRDKRGVNVLTSDRISDLGNGATFYDCRCAVRAVENS